MNDCPREFDCDSCCFRGTLDCPLEDDLEIYPGENVVKNEIIYARRVGGKLVQTARLKLLGIGKYAFETSLFGEKPYETNMNMPLFDTEQEAYQWIDNEPKWTKKGENDGPRA